MWRFAGGVVSALLLVTAGIFVWRAQAVSPSPVPAVPKAAGTAASAPLGLVDLAGPPTATEKTREEKRFARFDKNKNGIVARDEYLASRQKAFAKLDVNGDGRLSLDEYAVKAVVKFAAADRDKTGGLNANEFATTRVVRKARPRPKCLPVPKAPAAAAGEDDQEG
jgi:EF hand